MSASPKSQSWSDPYDTHLLEPWARDNSFLTMAPESRDLPTYPQVRSVLPEPFWTGHPAVIDCYWRAWELAFGNLKSPTPENGFVSSYCDTAFNGNLFMWDSCFITGFGLYGRRAFNFQQTLDNFYRKQHPDGFICREITEKDGIDTFHRFEPCSTGPNILAWAEWNHFLKTGDRSRLEKVFPPLVAFHRWLRGYHTWQDGSYWTTGWGCGMDNLPRPPFSGSPALRNAYFAWGHGRMTWVDATLQAILSAKTLLQIGQALGREKDLADMREEAEALADYANRCLWDEKTGFYYDRFADGQLSSLKHIGAYWALPAGIVPANRLERLLDHLRNPAEFNRTHRVPALSADDPAFSPSGDYWCGGIWASTNYMVLKGLAQAGALDLGHEIAANHLQNVVAVYQQDDTPWKGAEQFKQYFHLTELVYDDHHTLWETYAPDRVAPGNHSRPGYVGWTGLPPIAVLLEDVFGLVPEAPANRLTWRIELLEEHGVRRYPFGQAGIIDLECGARESPYKKPEINIHSNVPLTVEVVWKGGRETLNITPNLTVG